MVRWRGTQGHDGDRKLSQLQRIGQIYKTPDAPRFIRGHSICAGVLIGGVVIAIIARIGFYRMNKRLDAEQQRKEETTNEDLWR